MLAEHVVEHGLGYTLGKTTDVQVVASVGLLGSTPVVSPWISFRSPSHIILHVDADRSSARLTFLGHGRHHLHLRHSWAESATCFGAQEVGNVHAPSLGHHDEESARGRSCCQKGRIAKLKKASVDGFCGLFGHLARSSALVFRKRKSSQDRHARMQV